MDAEPKEGLAALTPHIGDTSVAPAVGIGAIALEMAMKYHAINTVSDGSLYQQYKLEGRNMIPLQLQLVFETAMRIEAHLLGASERIAGIVLDAVLEPEDPAETENDTTSPDSTAAT